MKKKIYLISQTESELTNRGKRHPNLADFLNANGFDLEYYSSSFYHAEKVQFTRNQITMANKKIGYQLNIIKTFTYYRNIGLGRILSNFKFSYRVFQELKKKKLENSIIILPSRPIEVIYFISKLKNKKNIKLVLDIRDVWPDAFNINNFILKKAFKIYCDFFLKKSLPLFDTYIHTCPKFTDWLTRYVPNANSHFIPLGFENKRFEKVEIANRYLGINKIKFVYIGLLQYQIDIIPFIHCIKNDERFSLTIYGDDGEGEKYNQLINYVSHFGVKNVFIKGKIPQNQVGEILNGFHIGLMPMRAKFAFPNKVFDYIALCLPIFSMGNHDVSTFVNENKIGWVSNYEKTNINKNLENLFLNKEYQIPNFSKKIASIKENFSRNSLFKKYLKEIIK